MSTIVAELRAAGCVFAEDEAQLLTEAAATPAALAALVARRVAGEPLEHLLGWAEFCGLRVAVTAGVFVPRRRTEFLARQAIARVRPGAVVVDLCCGCGALGAAVTAAMNVDLYAADIDPAAVDCARRNLKSPVYQGDLFDPLPARLRGKVTVLVVNAPYVPTDAIALMPPEARDHEPRQSLDGGTDGLDILRRVITEAPGWLAPGGTLLFETGERQVPAAEQALRRGGLHPTVARCEDSGATVLIGTLA